MGRKCAVCAWIGLHRFPIYECIINASRGSTARVAVVEAAGKGGQHHFLLASPKTISEQAIECWPLVLLPLNSQPRQLLPQHRHPRTPRLPPTHPPRRRRRNLRHYYTTR